MQTDGYKKVCKTSELNNYAGKRILVNDVDIAIFKFEGKIFALNNICPHQHTALIYDGYLEDGCVVCPAHGWKFQLKDGKMPDGRNGLASYPVVEKNDFIYVKVENKINW